MPIHNTDAAWRRDNLGMLLFTATDRCIRDKLRVVHQAGFGAITDAQLALFHNLDVGGTRLTVLSARAGITKQSMIELVDKAEAAGLVDRRPDPQDRRAKIVGFTSAGFELLEALRDGILAAEAGVAAAIGGSFVSHMKRELAAYVTPSDVGAQDDAGWRSHNIARLLSLSARRFAHNALGFVHERGYRAVSEVLLALFRNLDLDGTRLTDLADRARMTKQSMRELVDRAEALGFVARHPDPEDGRAKVIGFTTQGLLMLEEMRRGIGEAEAHFATMASPMFLATLKACLSSYNEGGDPDVCERRQFADASPRI